MTTALSKKSGSEFELTLTIPWADVKAVYDKVFEELASEIEVEGFRKGKAPKNLIESKVDKNKVYGEVVNRILPKSYSEALSEHGLKPVISPQVQIISAEESNDWQFIARAAEKPTVDLNGYKEAISGINAKSKIWTPASGQGSNASQGQTASDPKKQEEEKSKQISEIIDQILKVCKVELAELIIESEVNRLMTQLIDDVRNAGLTFEQYLASSTQSSDSLRQKYRTQAETALKLEFILEAIASDLNVQVSQEEIKSIIDKETDPERKKALTEQSYVLASMLRRENTITKLLTL